MHRGDLMTVELELAGETLSSRSKIIETQSGSRISATAARVECADGSSMSATRWWGLTGCGPRFARSSRRRRSDLLAIRGLPRTLPIEEAPADSDFDNVTLWVGPDLHFVQYCVRSGKLFNQVAVFRSYR